jgi:hypothetical protein
MPDVIDFVQRSSGSVSMIKPTQFGGPLRGAEGTGQRGNINFFLEPESHRSAFPYDTDEKVFPRVDNDDLSILLTTYFEGIDLGTYVTIPLSPPQMKILFFKPGDYVINNILSVNSPPDSRSTLCNIFGPLTSSISSLGFRYGIMNIDAQYAKSTYSDRNFGQFRDMFEQRLDGKFILAQGSPGKSPVSTLFVDRDDRVTSPIQTQSSNLSFESTSSVPYIDNISRNRGSFPVAEIGTTIVEI